MPQSGKFFRVNQDLHAVIVEIDNPAVGLSFTAGKSFRRFLLNFDEADLEAAWDFVELAMVFRSSKLTTGCRAAFSGLSLFALTILLTAPASAQDVLAHPEAAPVKLDIFAATPTVAAQESVAAPAPTLQKSNGDPGTNPDFLLCKADADCVTVQDTCRTEVVLINKKNVDAWQAQQPVTNGPCAGPPMLPRPPQVASPVCLESHCAWGLVKKTDAR